MAVNEEVFKIKLESIETLLQEVRVDIKEVRTEQHQVRIGMAQTEERLRRGTESFAEVKRELLGKVQIERCAEKEAGRNEEIAALKEAIEKKIDSRIFKAYMTGAAFGGGLGGGILGALLTGSVKIF
jgi:hypothetical protein